MKITSAPILGRVTAFFLGVLFFVLLAFACFTFYMSERFYEASTQLLNKDVAAHIARFSSPIKNGKLDSKALDSIFQNAMVLNPSAEVYFLDNRGRILASHEPHGSVKLQFVPLRPLDEEIAHAGREYLKSPDPKEPETQRIFSASLIRSKGRILGYIYVILGSLEYRNVTELLFRSRITSFVLVATVLLFLLSVLASMVYLNRFQRRFSEIDTITSAFRSGNHLARFQTGQLDEFSQLTTVFNEIADLLVDNLDKLKNAERERQTFIVNISHDLRTPLSLIRGYTETMLMDNSQKSLSPLHRNHLQIIMTDVLQLEGLVAQLFELSRLESPFFALQKEPFVFSDLLMDVMHAWQLKAESQQITLSCHDCQNSTWITADISQIERVLYNLMDNAIKYTGPGGCVSITLENIADFLELRISNTGPSVPEHMLEFLVSASSVSAQSTGSRKRSVFGLAIVKRILFAHGFEFSFHSKFENVFTIKFPNTAVN